MSTLILAIVALVVNVAVLVFVLMTRKHSRQMEAERQQVRRETIEMLEKFREETKL